MNGGPDVPRPVCGAEAGWGALSGCLCRGRDERVG